MIHKISTVKEKKRNLRAKLKQWQKICCFRLDKKDFKQQPGMHLPTV